MKRASKHASDFRKTRPPLDRMLRIHQEVQGHTYPNSAVLGQKLEISTKTVHRDVEFMRERLNLPIEWDGARNGYYYTRPVTNFPTMHFTEGELVALVVAEKALQQYRGTTFEKPLLSAIKKMEESLPDTISLSLSDVHQTISFRTSAEQILDLEVFDALAKATAAQRQIEFAYRKPGEKQTEQRRVDPYHLANINGEWYLFAYDHLRKDIRTFVPARIKSIKQTGKTFSRVAGFSLEQRLRNSFGVHSGKDKFDVVIRFNDKAADYIREKRWHDSQELKGVKGGAVELRMRLSSLAEVERWVLSWGGNATVVKPAELAESIRQAAKRILNARR
jgi:predicted DNA-binding transcriptional regulator YafY